LFDYLRYKCKLKFQGFSSGEIIGQRVSENSILKKKGLHQIQDISLYDKIRQKHPLVSYSTNN